MAYASIDVLCILQSDTCPNDCQLLWYGLWVKYRGLLVTKNKGNENSTRFDTHDNHPAWTSSNVEQSCRRHALSISHASTAVESHCGPLPTPANLRSDTTQGWKETCEV